MRVCLLALAVLALGCDKKISVEECRKVCDPYAVEKLTCGSYSSDCVCNNSVLMDYPEKTH